jgi:hypothetical protein
MTSQRQGDGLREPLADAYLAECEHRARRFSGAFTGTSGTLAAMVLTLLAEVRRLRVELAREHERRQPCDGYLGR